MVNQKSLYKEVHLKSELQHGKRLLCLMYYSSSTFASLYFHCHMKQYSVYLLTPWSTVLLEKLTCFQLVKKFDAFHGTCPPPVPILSQLDPVHTPKSHFLKIQLNIILPPMPGSPKWSLSSRFLHQNPVYASPLPHTCYMPAHLILLDFITLTTLGEQYRSLSSSLYRFSHSPIISSLLGPNILFYILFSKALSLLSSIKKFIIHSTNVTIPIFFFHFFF